MMFRPKKNNVQHMWAWQNQCFALKKTMFSTFGAVQRCFAGKKRCSPHLGLGQIDVSPKKKRCSSAHLGLGKIDV
jgi:hypothetical protein